jgi:hypothetical protein
MIERQVDMATANEPTVYVLKDRQLIRKLKRSLTEADRDDTVGLEEAYAYWMHEAHGQDHGQKSDASIFTRIALPAIGALIGSVLTQLFARGRPHSNVAEEYTRIPIAHQHEESTTRDTASRAFDAARDAVAELNREQKTQREQKTREAGSASRR